MQTYRRNANNVRALITAGADTTIQDNKDQTPLNVATWRRSNEEVIQILSTR